MDAVGVEVLEQPDGSVVVRGLSLEEARARLAVAPFRAGASRGRPAKPAISLAEIQAVVDELVEFDLPLTQVDLAAALGVSRTRLRVAIRAAFGSWSRFSAISATRSSDT